MPQLENLQICFLNLQICLLLLYQQSSCLIFVGALRQPDEFQQVIFFLNIPNLFWLKKAKTLKTSEKGLQTKVYFYVVFPTYIHITDNRFTFKMSNPTFEKQRISRNNNIIFLNMIATFQISKYKIRATLYTWQVLMRNKLLKNILK